MLIPFFSNAQEQSHASITITAIDNKKFIVFVNGTAINATPENAIRIEKLNKLSYQLKIVGEDAKLLPVVREKFFVCNKSGALRDFVYTLQSTSSALKLIFVSMKTSQNNSPKSEALYVYDFEKGIVVSKKADIVLPKPDTIKSTVLAISTKTEDSSKVQIKQTIPMVKEPADWHCRDEWPIWKSDFEKGKSQILSEKTGNQQLRKAKEFTGKSCLTTEQVIEIGMLLNDEDAKLDFALFAIDHTIDIKNFYRVDKIFLQAKTKTIFTNFISK